MNRSKNESTFGKASDSAQLCTSVTMHVVMQCLIQTDLFLKLNVKITQYKGRPKKLESSKFPKIQTNKTFETLLAAHVAMGPSHLVDKQ